MFVIKSAKIMCFLRFSIARIWPKFKKICQISIYGLSKVAQNIEGCLKILLAYLACSQIWLNIPFNHCHFGYSKMGKKIYKLKKF